MRGVKLRVSVRLLWVGLAALTVGTAVDGCGSGLRPLGGMAGNGAAGTGGGGFCSAGVLAEMADCTYDPGMDYSCYRLPTEFNPLCPANPKESGACSLAPCTVCNSNGGLIGGTYTDSAGMTQTGYCICEMGT